MLNKYKWQSYEWIPRMNYHDFVDANIDLITAHFEWDRESNSDRKISDVYFYAGQELDFYKGIMKIFYNEHID